MATIDNERNAVVVRIVYDGPPLAGKTANLLALRDALKTAGELYSPESGEGPTRYFEWLDYTGGVFNGRAIACQIVATPGHPSQEARRRYLLQSADAVIFVLDARPSQMAVGLEYLDATREMLGGIEPPVKLIVQANKQEEANALSEDRLALFVPGALRVMGACTAQGKGVRETFVFAVSLAVERLRVLMQQGKLGMGPSEVPDGGALYTRLAALPDEPVRDPLLAELLD